MEQRTSDVFPRTQVDLEVYEHATRGPPARWFEAPRPAGIRNPGNTCFLIAQLQAVVGLLTQSPKTRLAKSKFSNCDHALCNALRAVMVAMEEGKVVAGSVTEELLAHLVLEPPDLHTHHDAGEYLGVLLQQIPSFDTEKARGGPGCIGQCLAELVRLPSLIHNLCAEQDCGIVRSVRPRVMDYLCLHSQVGCSLSFDMTPVQVFQAVEAQGPISMTSLIRADTGQDGTDVRQVKEPCKNGHGTSVEKTTLGVADALCIHVSREFLVGGDDGSAPGHRIPAIGRKVVDVDSIVVGGCAYRLISFVVYAGSGDRGHYFTYSLRRVPSGDQGRVKEVWFRCDDASVAQLKRMQPFNEAKALAGTYMYIR
mmetsp:Transcript_3256/g.10700  ORF Transcript_3256/g.10700 Transcript_3256/m.10700 type:complete len:367 (+) Transcript_3256:2769-3869(+)